MDLTTLRVRVRVLVLVLGLLFFNLFFGFGCHAQPLPEPEVSSLRAISAQLKILKWKVDQNSCNDPNSSFVSEVSCTCSVDSCSVYSIRIKRQNLRGHLPAAFANLSGLTVLDLTGNFISGPIPADFGRLPLRHLSLSGNQLSDQIPPEIGDIASLEELVLENNQLGGILPESLGKLSRLRRLLLSANYFTGPIPESYGNLRNLTDFWIDGNGVSGKLPEFIGNWTNIKKLYMQGTSMETPIPDAISKLKSLEELGITDLKGLPTSFPDLTQLTSLRRLFLRNCLIHDRIPDYMGQSFNNLEILDLSCNRLSGPIPETFGKLVHQSTEYMFMGNNSLSGQVPDWIMTSGRNIDLSYNNFTRSSVPNYCRQYDVNLVSSYSTIKNGNQKQEDDWCLRKNLPCPKEARYDSLFINCGGKSMNFTGNEYEGDTMGNSAQSSSFDFSKGNWGYSSTGLFLGNEGLPYTVTNTSPISATGVYETARVAPVSLKYYGFCLRKGSYNVKLHFAEIMFTTAHQDFSESGRRIFDISIQGKLIQTDFNLTMKAGGVGKSYILEETDIQVNKEGTLEIHLYWAGKGTNAIPERGVFGPLISAITVTSDADSKDPSTPSKPPISEADHVPLSAGAIVGILAAEAFFIILVLGILWWRGCLGWKITRPKDWEGLSLQIGSFTLKQITTATNNFDSSNKIGEGGFGPVYKGILPDGTVIAVKKLSSKSNQGKREFVNEIGTISSLQHPYLVKLYGCCTERDQLLLVYEYVQNNSLARALFGPKECQLELNWPTRLQICIGIAKGLAFLHEESGLKIVHRDIKGTNILLDENLTPKISDFGLAKLDEEENTHMTTRIAGTFGYMAPEYATRGHLTDKADVYSFGIVALEIVSGRSNTLYRSKEKCLYLLDWALVVKDQGNLLELVDPRLGSNFDPGEAMAMINIALLCTNVSFSARPTMSSVVSMLEGKAAVEELTTNPNDLREEINAMWSLMQQNHKMIDNDCHSKSASSMDMPSTNPSSSF
ncbi:probable LRR receptor-like serine/threonine-protein kinase At1g53440 isoform X1 [Cucurbita moschata]|uniref:non-specific serine/threonine protein kinase n=1 Tax=Cucurbita moschata TaxID=3662 RepID=A0A6J1FC62_CUCMO|nr:probable LRR receptor-like serine/threonine-protein kinase At1g53440 isoform X1 [Cucurbita moschata]